jgi:hypothetical protein
VKISRHFRSLALLVGLCSELACRGQVATTPPVENPPPAQPRAELVPARAAVAPEEPVRSHAHAEGQLGPGAGVLLIDLAAPQGAKLTLDAPVSARGSGGIGLSFPRRLTGPLNQQGLPLRLPIEVADGATGPAQVELSYYWCTDGNQAACRRELALVSVDLDLSGSGAGGEAHLSHKVLATD